MGIRSGARRHGLISVLAAFVLGACTTTGPITVKAPQPLPEPPGPVPAALVVNRGDDCRIDPTFHILAIDKRGDYRPVSIPCSDGRVLRQVGPGDLGAGCEQLRFAPLLLTTEQVQNYSALQCQITRIVGALLHPPDGRPQHLVVFIHGGLNTQQASLDRASSTIPLMVRDAGAFAPIVAPGLLAPQTLMQGSEIFPLFLDWPSGFFDTYGDALTAYRQGVYGGRERLLETPLYLGDDLGSIGVRAPLDLVKSLHRWLGSEHAVPAGEGCGIENFGCNELGPWRPPVGQDLVYAATTPLRLVTVPALDIATSAWKNMVARTRFGIEKYVEPADYRKVFLSQQTARAARASEEAQRTQKEILTKGAFYLFFDALWTALDRAGAGARCGAGALRITLIGHSMGAIVTNEILREFPELPYENIVFMAAASSIRDFKSMTEPVLRRPACDDLRFYDLTLHEDWDAREVELGGAAPRGSLLEWIDDIFETPVTPIDRTLGKWENVIYAEDEFDPIAAARMFFHRLGLETPDPLSHGAFADLPTEITPDPDVQCQQIPYWRPQFWAEVRKLGPDGSCPPKRALVTIAARPAPSIARPNMPGMTR